MIKLKNVTFHYQESEKGVFDINLSIPQGGFYVITGPSGCGKTTLTRLLNGLIPHYYEGELKGDIILDGKYVAHMKIEQISTFVGSVFQNPRSQFYNINSTDEVVFQAENCGLDKNTIISRMNHVVEDMQIQGLMNRSLFELSGGEKQKIACASLSVSDSKIIVLDEPSSNLDIMAIEELRKMLIQWKSQGKTIIISEHRLFYLRELLDQLIIMKDGRISSIFSYQQVKVLSEEKRKALGLRTLCINQMNYIEKECMISLNQIMRVENFTYYYDKEHGIDNISIDVPLHSIVGIIGHNGAGKSTLAKALCGLLKNMKGSISIQENRYEKKKLTRLSYMVMQDVNHQLFTESVLDEIVISINKKGDDTNKDIEAKKILKSCRLAGLEETHPMALSGGQKQRVAIATALASSRPVIIFDEPTSGLDYIHMLNVAKNLKELQKKKTLFVITHDLELIYETCTHILHIENGALEAFYELNPITQKKLLEFASL